MWHALFMASETSGKAVPVTEISADGIDSELALEFRKRGHIISANTAKYENDRLQASGLPQVYRRSLCLLLGSFEREQKSIQQTYKVH
jgi:hypothetical protein